MAAHRILGTILVSLSMILASACKREQEPNSQEDQRTEPSFGSHRESGGPISALGTGRGGVGKNALVGTWLRSPDGSPGDIAANYRFTTHYKEDNSLEFSMEVEGEGVLSGEGIWLLQGNQLTSTITASTDAELAEPGTEVVVDVLKITEDSFRYRVKGMAAITETRVQE